MRIHVSRATWLDATIVQLFYRLSIGARVRELLIEGSHAEVSICVGRKCVSTNHRYVCID